MLPSARGSSREAAKVSPALCDFVEMVDVVRTVSGVPASSVMERGAAGRGAGAAEEDEAAEDG